MLRPIVFLGILLMAGAASAETYTIGEGSKITYHVVHPMHDVIGVNGAPTGEIDYDVANPTAFTGVTGKPIQAEWEGFDSGNSNRDANARATVNAQKYPTLTFVIERIEAPRADQGTLTGTLHGRMYVNGRRKPVSGPLKVDFSNAQSLKAHAELAIKMSDFEIERPSLLFVKTEDEVGIDVDLILVPKPAP